MVTAGNVIGWAVTIGIGLIILALAGYIWKSQVKEISSIKDWIAKRPSDILTSTQHIILCVERMREIEHIMEKQTKDLKAYFDLKVENSILKEIRKKNGGGYQ